MPQVDRRVTPLAWADVMRMIPPAFERVYGLAAGPVMPYIAAMIAIENAKGKAFIGHNWGNITTNSSDVDYWMSPETGTRKFPVFPTHEAGLDAFLRRLGSKTHQRIIQAALRDDFNGFFDAITLPHPKTNMAYCPDCRTAATQSTYLQLVNEGKAAQGAAEVKKKE